MADRGCGKGFCSLFRNLLLAVVLYTCIYTSVSVYQTGSTSTVTRVFRKPSKDGSSKSSVADNPLAQPSDLMFADMEKINIHANWFNRPESLVVPKDDFLGKRPDVDTIANLTKIVEECRGSYEKFEKMPYVFDCLKWLEEGEKEYFYLPDAPERESAQSPRHAEYLDADGHDNSLSAYPAYKAAFKGSMGTCNGPIVPYHTYWTGPATWRVEIFVKSYLHTQNLPCSRLWIWVDADRNPNAVEDMLTRDPLFRRFLPFIERGDIAVKAWNFPSRIALPAGDNTDGRGYYKTSGRPNAAGEVAVADGLMRDKDGQEWLVLTEKQKTFLPVAISDAVRFIVLHQFGGSYYDMDTVMLRDMRPLLIGADEHNFAERWAAHSSPGDYNTAIMSLTANSSLSSYMLRGGVRMGMNFHPRVLGRMALKDGRNSEFLMLETAAFDPIWTEFNWARQGKCTVPCFKDYGQMFKGRDAFPNHDEWEAYDGPQLATIDFHAKTPRDAEPDVQKRAAGTVERYDEDRLARAEYRIEEDHYPPTNRTMENFFRGAWTYHIHNQVCPPSIPAENQSDCLLTSHPQWAKNPEPSSWFHVIQLAHDGFFAGKRVNPYGERWDGPELERYAISWEFT